jgi:hypothetical protein
VRSAVKVKCHENFPRIIAHEIVDQKSHASRIYGLFDTEAIAAIVQV